MKNQQGQQHKIDYTLCRHQDPDLITEEIFLPCEDCQRREMNDYGRKHNEKIRKVLDNPYHVANIFDVSEMVIKEANKGINRRIRNFKLDKKNQLDPSKKIDPIEGKRLLDFNNKVLEIMSIKKDKTKVDIGLLKEQAKLVPMETLIPELSNKKTICCIVHNERTPSMHFYRKDNRLHCFGGCGVSMDVIDVYQQLHNCTFVEAVKQLSKIC